MDENCTCVSAPQCTTDTNCGDDKKICKDNSCQDVECTKKEHCSASEECKDNGCVSKDCATDSDCSDGLYCESDLKICTSCEDLQIAEPITVDGVETCPSKSSKEVEKCGGVCICDADYVAVGNMCVDLQIECDGPNEIYDPIKDKCVFKGSTVPPPLAKGKGEGKGGGWCNLIR